MKTSLNQSLVSGSRLIGQHKDCGGDVFYHSNPRFAYRECKKCGQNGMRGTASPTLETE